MREALRAHQCSSELIRGTQHPWKRASRRHVVPEGNQCSLPRAISAHSCSSELISVAHVRRHVVPEGGQCLPKFSLSDAPVSIRVPLPK